MLLVDNILLSPYKGIKWIFNEVHRLAQEEIAGEPERIREELTELYRMLEAGELTEEAFDQREQQLLERLDEIEDEEIEDEENGA